MKKQLVITLIVAQFIYVGLSGCFEEDKFEGTWKSDVGLTYVFKSDGDLILGGIAGNWELKDDKLVLKTPDEIEHITIRLIYKYSFSDNDKKLTLTETSTGLKTVLTKQ